MTAKTRVVALLGDLEDRREVEGRGVVDEDVDAAGPRDDGFDETIGGALLRDVERHSEAVVAELGGEGLCFGAQPVGDDDAGAFGRVAAADTPRRCRGRRR